MCAATGYIDHHHLLLFNMRFISLVSSALLMISLTSCHSKTGQETKSTIDSTSTKTLVKDSLEDEQFDRIDSAFTHNIITDTNLAFCYKSPIAIRMFPDSLEIEREKQIDSDAFYAGADDFTYYSALALDTLDSLGIPTEMYIH